MELSTTTLSKIFSNINPEELEDAKMNIAKETGRFSGQEIAIIKNTKAECLRKMTEEGMTGFVIKLMQISKTYAGFNTSFQNEVEMQAMIVNEIKNLFLGLTHLEIYDFVKMGMRGELGGEINNFSPLNFARWGKAYIELKSPIIGKYLIEERKLEKEIEDRNKVTQEESDQRMKVYTLRELENLKTNPDYRFTDYGNAIFNFLSELGIQFNKETKSNHWKEAVGYYKLNGKKDFPQESRAYENFVKWSDKKAELLKQLKDKQITQQQFDDRVLANELNQPNYFYTLSISRSKQNCLMDYFKEVIEMEFELQSLIESLLEEKLLKNNSIDNQPLEKNL